MKKNNSFSRGFTRVCKLLTPNYWNFRIPKIKIVVNFHTFARVTDDYSCRKPNDMAHILDVSDYIISRLTSEGRHDLSTLKHQKLLYYTQAWHLAIHDNPLFEDSFQAWIHGPVNRTVYDRYKDSKSLYSLMSIDDTVNSSETKLSAVEVAHIEEVLEVYAAFSPFELESMTHQEDPWIEARKGYSEFERCEVEISNDSMKNFYRKRLEV